MSKELEALKYLKENKRKHWLENDKSNECLDLIETALKEKENMEGPIDELFSENGKVITIIDIKKKLKALKIIKELYLLDIWEDDRTYHLRPLYDIMNLKKEEYELLKEVL